MTTLAIHNPANGEKIADVPADDAASVAAKAARARAAQPAWAARPLAERKACIARFRDGVVRDLEKLAVTHDARDRQAHQDVAQRAERPAAAAWISSSAWSSP